jgi:tetratricopeptide (TPR) repeat protein
VRPSGWTTAGWALFGAATVAVAWANAARGPFQWDDYAVIVNNPRVHTLAGWARAIPTGIRPVLALSYTLQWIADAGPLGFHRFNLVVHALAVVLVWRFCLRLVGPVPAVVAALLFAVHPVQTEAVTYVTGRSASLTTVFYLTGLLLWPAARPDAWRRRLLALGAFAVALGCKETAVTWPMALLLVEVAAAPADGWRAACRRTAPAWIVAAAGLLLLLASPRYRDLLAFSLQLRAPLANLPSGVQALGYLLSRLVLIRRLSIDPALAPPAGWSVPLALGGAAIVVAAACAVGMLRRRTAAAFAVLWLLLQLLPTTSLIARNDVASERHLYPALLGAALLAALGLDAIRRRAPRLGTVAIATVVALLAFGTRLRNRDYESEAALWAAAARLAPTNSRAFNNLGWSWHRAGCFADARTAYETALRLAPDNTAARGNLAGLPAGPGATCAAGWDTLGLPR